jgi:hypothetical protein
MFCGYDENGAEVGSLPHEEGKNVKLPVLVTQGGALVPERYRPQSSPALLF